MPVYRMMKMIQLVCVYTCICLHVYACWMRGSRWTLILVRSIIQMYMWSYNCICETNLCSIRCLLDPWLYRFDWCLFVQSVRTLKGPFCNIAVQYAQSHSLKWIFPDRIFAYKYYSVPQLTKKIVGVRPTPIFKKNQYHNNYGNYILNIWSSKNVKQRTFCQLLSANSIKRKQSRSNN